MTPSTPQSGTASGEAGFTLIEALIAIVVLMVGIVAVTNLMIVAATSNTVASQATAAASSATQVLDSLRATPFHELTAGGDLAAGPANPGDCQLLGMAGGPTIDTYGCDSDILGVATIRNRWRIAETGDPRLLFIEVQSEATGALGAGRSRAYFTTFRACTDSRTQTEAGTPILNPCPDPS